MSISPKHYRYIILLPFVFMVSIITIDWAVSWNQQGPHPEAPYNAWTIEVDDYQNVRLSWDNRFFCGEWKVPIREHLTDNYCILSNGQQILPVSWTTSKDSVVYEEFKDEVIDTMRTIADRRGYVSERSWW